MNKENSKIDDFIIKHLDKIRVLFGMIATILFLTFIYFMLFNLEKEEKASDLEWEQTRIDYLNNYSNLCINNGGKFTRDRKLCYIDGKLFENLTTLDEYIFIKIFTNGEYIQNEKK